MRAEGPRDYERVQPDEASGWRLSPQGSSGDFEDWPALNELFPASVQGVNPNRGLEGSIIDTDRVALEGRMRDYFSDAPFEALSRRYPVLCEPRARYDPAAVREKLRKTSGFKDDQLVPYVVFPLDVRWIYYEPGAKLLNERRLELWENLDNNEFLIAVPQPRRASENRPILATSLFDLHLHDRGSVGFPATLRSEARGELFQPRANVSRHANLAKAAWNGLAKQWRLADGLGGEAAQALIHRLFRAVIAIGHAPSYEEDHKGHLAQGWLRLPIPRQRKVLDDLAALGGRVATLLDPLADPTGAIRDSLGNDAKTLAVVARTDGGVVAEHDLNVTCSYYGAAVGGWKARARTDAEAGRSCWGEATGDLYLNDKVSFRNVPSMVWEFELGGYPVMKKWLGYREAKRREGRPLSLEEADHFRGMVQRIAALLALHEQLDSSYERAVAACFTADELGLVG